MKRRRRPFLTFLMGIVSAFAWIGISVSTVFWTLLIAGLYLLHPLVDPQLRGAHRLASWWGRGLVRMAPGSRVQVSGRRNILSGRPVILMANHQSYVDVPALFFLPGDFKWMADDGLFRIPFFGWAMRMAGYIPVRRGNSREGLISLQRAKDLLAEGISVFIFPEGTRSRTGLLGRFQTGGFRLAAQTGTPIVPVVVTGTRQLLPRGQWAFRWGVRVQIQILPPIRPPDDRREVRALMRRVRAEMWNAYRRGLRSC